MLSHPPLAVAGAMFFQVNAMQNFLQCILMPLLFICHTADAQTPPCSPIGLNQIINPGFEQGYYAFTSDFGRGLNNATRCNCATQGWILVAQISPHISPNCQKYPSNLSAQYGGPNTITSSNPNDPSNTSVATLAICNVPIPDHTSGNGFFLTVDPDACEGRAYWRQKLQVCPNTNYYFSVWVQNIGGLPAPTFHFEVEGVPVTAHTLDLRVRGDINMYMPNAFTPNDDGYNAWVLCSTQTILLA